METVIDTPIGTTLEAPAPQSADVSESTPLTNSEKAVAAKDVGAFFEARREERFGEKKKEPPAAARTVETKSKTATVTEEAETAQPGAERSLSKREIDRNEKTRLAVERASADLIAENARLRAELNARTAPPTDKAKAAATTQATEDAEPDPSDAAKYPDGQFDRAFMKDLASWQTRQILREHDTRTTATQQHESAVREVRAKGAAQNAKVSAAFAADPTLKDKIDPAIGQLIPTIDLAPGEAPTFGNAVADWLFDTEHPVELALHLSDKAEQVRLSQLSPIAFLREQGRIEAKIASEKAAKVADGTAKEDEGETEPTPKITRAPDPGPRIGTRPMDVKDPIDGAIGRGDYPAYSSAKRAKGLVHYAG